MLLKKYLIGIKTIINSGKRTEKDTILNFRRYKNSDVVESCSRCIYYDFMNSKCEGDNIDCSKFDTDNFFYVVYKCY